MRSFRVLARGVRGLGSISKAQICARELASVAYSYLQASGLARLEDIYIYIYIYNYCSKVSTTTLVPKL